MLAEKEALKQVENEESEEEELDPWTLYLYSKITSYEGEVSITTRKIPGLS